MPWPGDLLDHTIDLGALAATTTRIAVIADAAGLTFHSAHFESAANITGADANKYTFHLKRRTSAADTTLATLDFATGTDHTAKVPDALTLESGLTQLQRSLATGHHLILVCTKTGSPSNLNAIAAVTVRYHRGTADE